MKKLITYLKALWRRGLDSQRKEVGVISGEGAIEHPFSTHSAPFGTCWQPSGKLHSVVRCAAMLVMFFTIGSGNAWADYTITFATQSGSDGTSALTTKATAVTAGGDYISTWSSNYVYTGGSNAGLKFASSKKTGYVTMTMTTSGTYVGQIKASKITFKQAKESDDCSISYTITYTDATTTSGSQALTTTATDYDISLTSSKTIQTIDIRSTAAKKRFYLQAITITAAGGAVSHTLSSAVSPAASGSVSLGATSVAEGSTTTATATPNSGYVFSSWSISGTGASLSSTTDNPTTVTMGTANATVTATFAARTAASITFVNAGTPAPTTSGYYVGDSYTLPSTNNYSCNGKTFAGWSTVPVAETDIKPTSNFYEPGASATLAASQTFYAVFASVTEGTGDWEQCSSSTIADGDYLIVQSDYMMTNTLNSQRFNKTYIAISAGVISYDAKADWSAYTWHIAETSTSGIFTIKNGNNYVIGTGTASKIDLVSTPADDKELFAITYQSTPGTYKIVSKYNEAASVNRWLRNGGSYFACYADGGYPYLFKRGSGYGNYCTTCAVTHTVSAVVNPAGKATVTLGATTVAEGGTTTATYSAITTGYEFVNWTISGTGATLSSTTANPTTITMGTANVTVTANLQCITPSISVHPASKTDYIVGDVATALSVTANAGGASLSYQWQVSNNNSDWSNIAAGDGGTAATYTPSTAAAGTKYYRVKVTNAATGCSTNATSNAATITVTAASGYCISAFNSSNNGITSGFSNGGSGNEYTLNYTIPGKDGSSNWPQYWIGENEAWASFSANALFADMHFTHSDATLGLAEGATGKLHIWDDNKASGSNLWVKFEPDGYGFRWGGAGEWDQAANTKAFTVDPGNANTYWTEIVTLDGTNNTTWNYYVGLQSASGYVYSGVDNEASDSRGISRTRSVTTMKVSNGTAGSYKATYLNSEATGTRGKFRIWDNNISDHNFVCHFVPYYRVTYNGSGASGSTDPSADVSCEGNDAARTVVAAANGFTVPTGKTFGGWASSPENAAAGVVAYAAGANVVLTSSITLYAIWTDINYTVTVNQNPSVGATTTGQTTTAHYNGTINLTTTVPSGYRFVNWTTSDGFSITNPTSATTASFTMPAKNVTVTANFQQTHKVDWYVGGSAPANKIGDDGQTTVVDHGGKISDFPAHDPDGSACDKTFVGWTNTSSYVHGTSPLFNDVAGSPTINADASFYAVFATGGSGEIFSEDFASFTSGSISSPSSSAESSLDGFDNITYVYQAGGVAKLGTGSYSGSLTTDELTIAAGSSVTISFEVFGWKSVEGDIIVSCDNSGFSNQTVTYTATRDQSMESKSVTVTCTVANPKITIATSTKRAYIDNISISASSYTGYTINCADCGTSVTPTYAASPTGATVSVTKSASPVTSGSTVKTCTSVDLTVTITPASHYTLTGFTATGLSTGTATISPAVNTVVPTTSAQTFTVTVSAGATGTLNLTPTLEEDAHKVISWVVHGGSASIADGHGTTWVYSGEDLTAIPTAPDAPTGCDDKVFVGWSENDGGATEEDASYYDDRFTTLGEAPTGITTDKTFTAVFATPAAGLGGTVMWDEPFDGDAGDQPSSPTSGATVYGSASIAYNCASTTYCKLYTDNLASGGAASPELLVPKSSRGEAFEVTGIPTAGQTELTLTYMAKDALSVTTGTSGVTVGDASADGKLYTRTITIDQSGLGVATFGLTFAKSTDSNSRLDDIHLVVPGSSSMSGYITTCEDTWTVTYYKNTEDAVTNLPSPTGISKSTGSGTLSSKVPVRYGYTFDGWATSAGGSVVYAAGAAVSSVSADMDLYAKWSVTPVTEINLSKTSLDKYVGDPSVTLSVLSVLPDGANTSVTWSSSNSSIASVNSSTGEVNFVAEGTANIIATSSITSGTTATCVVTVWAKPTATFLDNMHGLTVDENSVALSSYNLEAAAGTAVVFPTLANQIAGSGTCEDEHYIFVGWTTSDNNDDPEDHLVSSYTLTNGDAITYYAVWADGVSGTTYVKLTDNSFSTSKHYVIGAVHPDNGTTYYFNSCAKTDKDNSWGYVTADLASNTPIEFTLSGTASALVATTTESTSRYLKPTSTNEFHMSSTSQTIMLKSDGKIYSTDETRRLLFNKSQPGLRWYGTGTISGSSNAYFYEVVAGGEVDYRTSCCADKVPAPTVTATQTSVSVTLNWNDLSGSGATGYEVSWNDGAWTSPSGTRTHSVSGLTPNTTYTWKVRATYTTPKCGADIASGSTTTNQVYHVTYAGGSGTGTCNATGSTTDATAYEAGATVTLKANGFTLVGHTFDAWTEDDEDITISSNQFTMPEHDVVITATWTPKVDKFYDRMHDGTDASHGGIADGDGKYYITREGCSYTVPSLTDNTSGATACHTKHYVLMGWTAESHLNSDGTLKTGHEGYVYTGGGTQTATGATYYAVWAEVEE